MTSVVLVRLTLSSLLTTILVFNLFHEAIKWLLGMKYVFEHKHVKITHICAIWDQTFAKLANVWFQNEQI